jgi:cytochrome c oxidase subunit 1
MSTAAAPEHGLPVDSHHDEEVMNTNFWKSHKGIMSWIYTLDHKRIGIMYLVSTMSAFGLGGFFAMMIRLELFTINVKDEITGAVISGAVFSPEQYNQIFTLHGALMVFLFIIPAVPAALGNFFMPIMLGAKDVAFPRLNLASFYIYMFGSVFAVYSMVQGAVDTGWTFYTPYSTDTRQTVIAMTFGVFILGFSSILTGLNFVVTVHKMRAPGMTWFKMPLFVWAIYATAIIQVLATPVLAITLMLLIFERFMGVGIFDPLMGGDPVLFQHFFWFYSHPAVYIMILPGMGIISELISTFSKKPVFGYTFIAFSSLGLALLGFLVWGHHMFTSGQSEVAVMVFSALTFLVAIPSAIKVFNWLATMYRGSISLKTPMLYALAFIFMFSIGGLTGIFLGTLSVDLHLHDTYFVVAHFHYVMMGGTVMAFLGGLHYWWPKMFGRMYPEKLGQVIAGVIFTGFNVTFFTQFVLGSQGMPRRYYNYLDQYQTLHQVSSIGAFMLGAGFFVMLLYLLYSLKWGPKAPDNPWGGCTLEWKTETPPVHQNFRESPVFSGEPYDYRPPGMRTESHS